jgi:phosphate transport system substrate-binding protein
VGRNGDVHLREHAVKNQNDPVAPTAGPAKSRPPAVRVLVIVAIGVVLGLLIYFAPQLFFREEKPPVYPQLQLGGTSTVFVIVENRWKGKYRDDKGVQISYESTGSMPGVMRVLDGTHAITFPHGQLSGEQRQQAQEKGREVINIPVLLCGVATAYNLKELKGKAPLKLTGEVLADIFLGKIKAWNDPALKAVNPGVELPPTPDHRGPPRGPQRHDAALHGIPGRGERGVAGAGGASCGPGPVARRAGRIQEPGHRRSG